MCQPRLLHWLQSNDNRHVGDAASINLRIVLQAGSSLCHLKLNLAKCSKRHDPALRIRCLKITVRAIIIACSQLLCSKRQRTANSTSIQYYSTLGKTQTRTKRYNFVGSRSASIFPRMSATAEAGALWPVTYKRLPFWSPNQNRRSEDACLDTVRVRNRNLHFCN